MLCQSLEGCEALKEGWLTQLHKLHLSPSSKSKTVTSVRLLLPLVISQYSLHWLIEETVVATAAAAPDLEEEGVLSIFLLCANA